MSEARAAVQVLPHQLPEMQRAARLLLAHPLVTATHPDPEALPLVRRWETVLRHEFDLRFGYRLDVTRTAARLLRRPGALSSHRGAHTPTGRPFGRWAYVFTCLTLAVVERAGAQILGSELVERIEGLARGDQALPVDLTVGAQRRALVDSLSWLDHLGVLRVRDGRVEGLLDDGQVLFDIDRDAVALVLVASPSVLREVATTADFLVQHHADTPEARTRAARHRVNRRIVDSPVVHVDELDEDEAEVVARNRRREAAAIGLLTGCTIELRREGLALIDQGADRISRTAFPGTGTVAWAGLVWLAELVDAAVTPPDAADGSGAVVGDGAGSEGAVCEGAVCEGAGSEGAGSEGAVCEGVWDEGQGRRLVPAGVVERTWAEVVEAYGARFAAEHRKDPVRLRRLVLDLLVGMGLVRLAAPPAEAGSLVLLPLAARFRPEVTLAESSGPAAQQQSLLEL